MIHIYHFFESCDMIKYINNIVRGVSDISDGLGIVKFVEFESHDITNAPGYYELKCMYLSISFAWGIP